jgi:HAMP domain-containing protein
VADARAALERSDITMAEFLMSAGLALRADLLAPFAHWITPPTSPLRYDTHFFLAMLPDGQEVGQSPSEADDAVWLDVAAAHQAGADGSMAMMRPTLQTLSQLSQIDRNVFDQAWSAPIPTIRPQPRLQ